MDIVRLLSFVCCRTRGSGTTMRQDRVVTTGNNGRNNARGEDSGRPRRELQFAQPRSETGGRKTDWTRRRLRNHRRPVAPSLTHKQTDTRALRAAGQETVLCVSLRQQQEPWVWDCEGVRAIQEDRSTTRGGRYEGA